MAEILGGPFIFAVAFFAVACAAAFVLAHPRISVGYVAGLAALVILTAAGSPTARGLFVLAVAFPITAAIVGGFWVAYSKR
jgi:hypothetical protein